MLSQNMTAILPELILVLWALIALAVAVLGGRDKQASALLWITVAMFAFVALWVGTTRVGDGAAFGGLLLTDAFSRYSKVAILLSSALVLIIGHDYMIKRRLLRFEFPVLITFCVTGMMIMVSAASLITAFVGLEVMSLSLYAIAALRRDGLKSSGAGATLMIVGLMSSLLLLYGAALVYGFTSAMTFNQISRAISGGESLGVSIGMAFIIAALAIKLALVPFHFWAPEICESAPTPVTAFLLTGPQLATFFLLARLLHSAFADLSHLWQPVLAVLSVVSMMFGAIAAIVPRNLKRFMAYGAMAHVGFALLGLAAGSVLGLQASLLYLSIYVTAVMGLFAFILGLEKDGLPVTDRVALHLYARREPVRGLAALVLLLALAGLPPVLGFLGKLVILQAAISAALIGLALFAIFALIVGAYPYLWIIYLMYFGESPEEDLDRGGSPVLWAVLVAMAGVAVLGIVNVFGLEPLAEAAARVLVP